MVTKVASQSSRKVGKVGEERRRSSSTQKATSSKRVASARNEDNQDDESINAAAAASLPLGKALASTEKSIRDEAIHSLSAYLSQADTLNAEPLSDLEMAKLWKGIFYCFWMSDKPRVQQALANEMAEIPLSIQKSLKNKKEISNTSWQFFEGFLDSMVREWWGLDKWRVDKFMMLVRRFINAGFRLLDLQGYEKESIARFTAMLIKPGGILQANDVKTPNGLMYHVCDIYLEELDKALLIESEEEEGEEAKDVPVTSLLQPFVDMAASCHSSQHFDRMMKSVIVPYLDDCLVSEAEQETKESENRASKRQKKSIDDDSQCDYPNIFKRADTNPTELRSRAFSELFSAASRTESVEARRRRIYKMCREEEERLEDAE
ncbi:hypothetical protein L7F22_068145 [Adiantum nelumboides]|nr:hypothetical protein [Adiantum nelumboides]